MTPSIGPITTIKFEEWFSLWFDYVQPYISDPALPLHRSTFERLNSPGSPLQGVIAYSDRALGFAHFYFHPYTWDVTEPCYIQDLYVAPSARGMGVAELLLKGVIARARERDSPSVHWRVRDSNVRAIAFYERVAKRTDRHCYSISLR